MSDLSCHVTNIIVAGDFNIDLIGDSGVKTRYLDLLSEFNLLPRIDGPSHVCGGLSSLIDHVLSSHCLTVSQSSQAVGVSDHHLQLVDFDIPVVRAAPRFVWVRSFRKCQWAQLRDSLYSAP